MSATGEHRIEVGEETRVGLPLRWVLALLGVAVVCGSAWAGVVTQGRSLDEHKQDSALRFTAMAATVSSQGDRLTRQETHFEHTSRSLERIEAALERMERRQSRGVRRAGGGE